MLFLFDIISEHQRIRDKEGTEFSDISAARDEAVSCAREQSVEELRCGRPFPETWRIEILDRFGNCMETIPFATLLTRVPASLRRRKTIGTAVHDSPRHADLAEPFHRSKRIFQEAQRITANMCEIFDDMRSNLASIDALGAARGPRPPDAAPDLPSTPLPVTK